MASREREQVEENCITHNRLRHNTKTTCAVYRVIETGLDVESMSQEWNLSQCPLVVVDQ